MQEKSVITTAAGNSIGDNRHSVIAGLRGPLLVQDCSCSKSTRAEAAQLFGDDRESRQRHLFDAIERRDYLRWRFCVQITPEADADNTPYSPFDRYLLTSPKLSSSSNRAGDLSLVHIETTISANVSPDLKPGSKVTFTVAAFLNRQFSGTVSQIRPAPGWVISNRQSRTSSPSNRTR